jgi:glycosyltransferase involved in cell wall biosynthesis
MDAVRMQPGASRVTVCIPTYNRRADLAKTLESLRAQTYSEYEVIVCDDASTDGTREMLASLKWDRLVVIRNERNLNLYGTMARLFATARGTYIGMQHDHDIYEPEFIESMVRLLDQYPNAGFACCGYLLIDDRDHVLDHPRSAEFDLFPAVGVMPGHDLRSILATEIHTPIAAMGTMFRRETVEAAGGYRPDWGLAADEDLYARVAARSDVLFVPARLFRMRIRPMDRYKVLGSWEALLTLMAFRRSLVEEIYAHDAVASTSRRSALSMRYLLRFVDEALVLWSRGDASQLRRLTELAALTDRPWRIPAPVRAAVSPIIETLARSSRLGARLGKMYRSVRRAKS